MMRNKTFNNLTDKAEQLLFYDYKKYLEVLEYLGTINSEEWRLVLVYPIFIDFRKYFGESAKKFFAFEALVKHQGIIVNLFRYKEELKVSYLSLLHTYKELEKMGLVCRDKLGTNVIIYIPKVFIENALRVFQCQQKKLG